MKKTLTINALLLAVLMGGFLLIQNYENHASLKPEINPRVADFHLPLLDPDEDPANFQLYQHLDRPTLITFWASWCSVCQQQKPNLITLRNEYDQKDLLILGIAVQDEREKVLASNWPWELIPTVFDEQNEVAHRFKVEAVPQSYLLNAKGQIILHIEGIIQGKSMFELEQTLNQLKKS